MLRSVALAAAAFLLLFVPTATAHTTVGTADGKYLVTAGNLDEPVTTFTKTGLDLIIRANQTGNAGITGAHLTLDATLIAPNGEELSEPLEGQFGEPGSYTFEDPYFLTLPGEYFLRVKGKINETDVDLRILVGSGPIPAAEELTFPDEIQSEKQLQQRIADLEKRLADLQVQVDAMGSDAEKKDGGSAPGTDSFTMLLLLATVGVVLARSRRTA